MNYSAINIQGNILSSEILEKIRTEDIRFQKAVDFGLNPSASIRDEINLAWSIAVSNWNVFKLKRESLSDTDSGTSETRKFWILPLLQQVLGYEMTTATAELINGKSYAISHRATNKDGYPIHIVGVNQSLDKRADAGGARLSPHALAQEYLNNNEHMYALVTNGRFLRLLRDATRLSRLSYLEFDLEQIMEEGLYVEFALMYRALHASRMPEKQDAGAESVLEFYHQEALASGSRIRERLSQAVEFSIKALANGLLQHPSNTDLRDKITNGELNAKTYYLQTLRLVYRMLFLLVIEERKLIYPEKRDEALNKKRSIYYAYYSVQRLTKLAEKLSYVDPRKTDLWQSLLTTFSLFEYEKYGAKMGIAPLGAGLFSPNALGAISQQSLDNASLLKVLRYLVTFENENGQRVRVNYADLDVEEFGSVYEGLLDYDPEIIDNAGLPLFGFVKGDDRSSSGSHYTPEELVRPLIKHSLDYLIEDKLKEADPEKGLLSLTICDVACGSGHILLSAARRVGFELAKIRSKEDQPTPSVLRIAVRDVIKNCIYGVDLNPLAVELCKVALWLEAHEPGEPLNFLDHHIKCGNAIVGLAHAEELEKGIASEAFKTLPGDEKEIASAFKKRNDLELKATGQLTFMDQSKIDTELQDVQSEFSKFTLLPENTPEQIEKKEKAYQDLTNGKKWWRLKNLADLQVAQFFIPKTTANKEKLTTHSQYNTYLKQGTTIYDRGASMAISQEKHFFHWFLEYPEVFQKGGFDCILGNPPYLGGSKISTNYGSNFLNHIQYSYSPISGFCDLITYFLRRDFEIIKENGFCSLISTNSIIDGNNRNNGFDYLINIRHANIVYAWPSVKWPGAANVVVSLFTLVKKEWERKCFITNLEVENINSFLTEGINQIQPYALYSNSGKAFKGTSFLGEGFLIEPEIKESLIQYNSKNSDVIYDLINGYDINDSPLMKPSRIIINFFDWELEQAKKYFEPYKIVEAKVKPIRLESNQKTLREKWWLYERSRMNLYKSIAKNERCFISARTSKHFSCIPTSVESIVYSDSCIVFNFESWMYLAILNSTLHNEWTWKYCSTMGAAGLIYTPSSVFETFPFPQNLNLGIELEAKGEVYHEYRIKLMFNIQLGLTKTYNLFHSNAITLIAINEKDKQVAGLVKHLQKTPDTISFDEAVLLILKLREIHKEMDEAVLEAYGWHQDDPKWGKAIQLRHDFYEVDYLPENDRVRYTIHPEARKEVLKRLLQLNHERYAEEVEQGLHDKKKAAKKSGDKKENKNKEEIDDGRTQKVLFPEVDLFNQENEEK
jgi:type I restriction-modification system DNA methylase subunit